MAARYWVGNGGDWDDHNHWSATSGGAGGTKDIYYTDDVIFDENSFTLDGQTVTMSGDPAYYSGPWVGSLDCRNVTHNPTFALRYMKVSGNFYLSANMSFTWLDDAPDWIHNYSGSWGGDETQNGRYLYKDLRFDFDKEQNSTHYVDFAGHEVNGSVIFEGTLHTWKLAGDLTVLHTIMFWQGTDWYSPRVSTFDANDYNVTCYHMYPRYPKGYNYQYYYWGSGTLTFTGDEPLFRETSAGFWSGTHAAAWWWEDCKIVVNIDKDVTDGSGWIPAGTTGGELHFGSSVVDQTGQPLPSMTINGVALYEYPNNILQVDLDKITDLITNDMGGGAIVFDYNAINTPYQVYGTVDFHGTLTNPLYIYSSSISSGYRCYFKNYSGFDIEAKYVNIYGIRVSSVGNEVWYACTCTDAGYNTGWTWECRPTAYDTVIGDPMETGVYTLGRYSNAYPLVLDFTYPISERDGTDFVMDGVEIGSILPVGNEFYVAWKYTNVLAEVTYGIDKLDLTRKLSGAYIETRQISGRRDIFANFSKIQVSYAEMPSGCSIELQYSKDSGANWVTMTVIDDTARKILYSEEEFEASHTAFRAIVTVSQNNDPAIERIDVTLR